MGNSIIRYDQNIDPREILFIDAERTYPEGNDGRRRLMELAIIDGTGASIYHSYFNPGVEVEHKFSRKGLVDDVLTFAPSFDSEWLCIKQLLKCKHVVAWWMDMEKTHFPEQLNFAKKLHCAQARFSPLIGDYRMGFGNYRQIGMWDAFDLLQLQQPPGYRHRASTDVHAMRMIWEWLEKTQPLNLLSHSRLNDPFDKDIF